MSNKGFDKNSIIGLVLIGAIMLVFSYLNQPSEEEIEAQRLKEQQDKDKKELVEKVNDDHPSLSNNDDKNVVVTIDSNQLKIQDSLNLIAQSSQYGLFASAANGEAKNFILENEKIKVTISNKGGRVSSVELKNFHTYDSLPLILFNEDSSRFNLELIIPGSTGGKSITTINTEELFFETTDNSFEVTGSNSKTFSFKLYSSDRNQFVEYKYTLTGDSYLLDYDLNTVGLGDVLSESPLLSWNMFTPNQEKTIKNQQQRSTIYHKYDNGEVDYVFETKYEEKKMENDVDWIMFKQQYFNATLIAKKTPFEGANKVTRVETIEIPEEEAVDYVQGMTAHLVIPYNNLPSENFAMQYYFGPNRFDDLKAVGIDMEESLDYGWGIFGWVNMILIRPVFNFLNGFNLSIGVIILLLTLIIKSLLFPITWKTYLSSAKMRVLKPEIAELTEKHKNDAMKKQQATMALYRQTGVNPLAGCIPMLIQMPILFALFRFFPATFDLRQKSLWWADDLSTYDSIYDLGFNIPMYGDHISLFTLMMAISMIFYTKANSQMTAGAGMEGAMASQMKMMTYLMPVMMLFFFNSYAAGLSLYYLIANIITIAQQFVIRKWIVDEDKLHAKIQANKTKPKKKKSGFAARMEQKMKEAQALQQQRKKK